MGSFDTLRKQYILMKLHFVLESNVNTILHEQSTCIYILIVHLTDLHCADHVEFE